ncbi:serine/threonine-protein kinase [Amycolatopsis sp. NPDC048633]|uniref:serine/threonine-protein kinase n=1 Tax=Amycolatopsis sp. NPDC048633 TaxID=3157095 RepID=UPI0033D4DBA9
MADEGDLVAGRYRLRAKAGLDDRGEVWRARDEQLDRDVAVKQLVPAGEASLREARVAAKLSHPHAVTVYDVIEHQGKPFLVMELLPTCLAEVLAERGRLPRGMVAGIGRQVAAALAAAHRDGILHRDVNPGTVLLTHDGTAKIADFGVARAKGEAIAYLAPEVAGGADATARSDVYSLGATLYTALEGHPPSGAAEGDREDVIAPVRTGPLADVLLRMLRRDPDRRPGMAEAAEMFAKVAAGPRKPFEPAPVARPRPLKRRTGKRRTVLVAAAVVVIAGATVIGVAVTGAANRPVIASPGIVRPPTPAPGAAGCAATAQVTESWSGGYKMLVTVRNAGPVGITGWAVTWQPAAGRRVDDLWDAKVERSGVSVTVVNEIWNGRVTVDGTTTFGLVAVTGGAGRTPESLSCSTR